MRSRYSSTHVAEDRLEVDAPVLRPRRRRARASSRGRPPRRSRRRRRARAAAARTSRSTSGSIGPAAEVDVERESQALVDGRCCCRRGRAAGRLIASRSLGPAARRAGTAARRRSCGQRPEVVDGVELRRQEVERDPAEARLQPDDARPRRRDAHRAAHVGALGQRHAARRNRRARTARRAARRPLGVPRVARHAPQRATP